MTPATDLRGKPDEEASTLVQVRDQLEKLQVAMRRHEDELASSLRILHPVHRRSGANLVHYLTLREHDVRPLQSTLAGLGLSSIGRAEEHVLDNLERVTAALKALDRPAKPDLARSPVGGEGGPPEDLTETAHELNTAGTHGQPIGPAEGGRLLRRNTEALLGPPPIGRTTRIMVTMPGEAADDVDLVRGLLERGMDCARINCAHDDRDAWSAMVRHLRAEAERLGRSCPILVDLPGPKLRTGPVAPGPRVVRIRPRRDAYGRSVAPGTAHLIADIGAEPNEGEGTPCIPVPAPWISRLRPGDELSLRDTRSSDRHLLVTDVDPAGTGASVELSDTTYLAPGISLSGPDGTSAPIGLLPAMEQFLVLRSGNVLTITADPAPVDPSTGELRIGCSLPEAIDRVDVDQRVWFDDGRIGGVVVETRHGEVDVLITSAARGVAKLRAGKSVNLPDTELQLPILGAADEPILQFIVTHADIVGLSFVQHPNDVVLVQDRLRDLKASGLGIMLKIETKLGFDRLPELLLQAMETERLGVMVARGDLAVEVGFERLAEIQEEILCLCDAAHVPVVWATQVLDQMARTGQPSRAEISDTVLGHRAECVMLNKGSHILEAVTMLDDILRRMGGHQAKRTPLLRPLRSWSA